MPNPANLPTFSRVEPMPLDRDANPFREGASTGLPSPALAAIINAAESAGHSLTGLDADRAVFSVFPGLGGAAVTPTTIDDMEQAGHTSNGTPVHQYTRTPAFTACVHHPAMGNVYEVHACADVEQVLAAFSTVSYG